MGRCEEAGRIVNEEQREVKKDTLVLSTLPKTDRCVIPLPFLIMYSLYRLGERMLIEL